MKIILDTDITHPENAICKIGSRTYGKDMSKCKQNQVNEIFRQFLIKNTELSDYEEDCMWMSYRYCIGRHTIASGMHAAGIWKNCKNRMSDDRLLFTAFDINREIENSLRFHKPYFHFPLTSLNRIYTSAVDIVCEFMEDYNIKSIDDFIKYRDIHVVLTDNERGYKFEVVTWEEWLRPQVHKIVNDYYANDLDEDQSWKYFKAWKSGKEMNQEEMIKEFERITRDMPTAERYYMHDFEDLFVWNDLVHCFDFEHHHESILTDGTHCKWFWTWTENTEPRDDGYHYKSFGYHKIRVPLDRWNGSYTIFIPDESIKENIY